MRTMARKILTPALGLLLGASVTAFAAAPSVDIDSGHLEYRSATGQRVTLTTAGPFQSPALADDGRTVAFIRVLRPQTPDKDGISELWVADGPTGRTRLLLGSRPSADPKKNLSWFDAPIFSVDGKYVYVTALAWGDESAVHEVAIATGKERFVVDGNLLSVVRSGPYRHDLLVSRHTAWPVPAHGFHYPIYVVESSGKVSFRVPGMERDDSRTHLNRWLTKHGWTAW